MEIAGKKAVIVGGASGFGKATAQALAKRGASVAVLDRPNSDGQKVADEIGGAFHPVDVVDFAGTEQVLQEAVDGLGGLHIALTTAGGGSAMRTMTKNGPHDLDIFRQVQDLNTVGTFNISRLAAAHMSKNDPVDDEAEERGVIINTSSIAAFEGQIGQVAYTASKAAIAGMCLTMARDLGSLGIRVLAIAPSLFATGLTAGVPEDMANALTKDAAFPRRLGRPRSRPSWRWRSWRTRCSTASAFASTRASASHPSSPASPRRRRWKHIHPYLILTANVCPYAVASLLATQWGLAALTRLGDESDEKTGTLRGDCLAGGYTASVILYNRPATSTYHISPGDLDEAITALLVFRGEGDVERQGAGWARVKAFREGVVNGAQACLNYEA